jgi:hypothetical protein
VDTGMREGPFMLNRELFVSCVTTVTALATITASADDEMVVSPIITIEPIVDIQSWANEYAGAARRVQVNGAWKTEVVATWMRDRSDNPNLEGITIRRAVSADCGLSWTIDEFTSSVEEDDRELDPCCVFDPVSKALYVVALARGGTNQFSRLNAGSTTWTTPAVLISGQGTAAHFPKAAAGPKPGSPNDDRIYVHGGYGLRWSDDLGANWSGPDGNNARFGIARVGSGGQLYIGTVNDTTEPDEIGIKRSVSLNASGEPVFLSDSLAYTKSEFSPDWLPTGFDDHDAIAIAVAPQDGELVYLAWMDKTSEASNSCGQTNHNVDIYFTMTEDATATNVVWDSNPNNIGVDAPRIIPAGVEMPGDQFHPWMEALTYKDAQGQPHTRLVLMFFDTRHNPDMCDLPEDALETFPIDVYFAYSDDEGQTWTEARLTPNSMDILLAMEVPEGTEPGNMEWYGEYNGIAAAGKRAFPLFGFGTSVYEGAGAPYGYTEASTCCITFGDIASWIDLTAVEGTISGSDDVSLITSSNDQRLIIGGTSASGGVFKTIVDVEFDTEYTSADANDEIDVRVECHAAESEVTGRILLKNQNTGSGFEEWLVFDVPQSTDGNTWKRLIPVIQGSGLAQKDYISSTGRIDVRLEMTRDQTPSPDGLISRYDFVQVQVIDN